MNTTADFNAELRLATEWQTAMAEYVDAFNDLYQFKYEAPNHEHGSTTLELPMTMDVCHPTSIGGHLIQTLNAKIYRLSMAHGVLRHLRINGAELAYNKLAKVSEQA